MDRDSVLHVIRGSRRLGRATLLEHGKYIGHIVKREVRHNHDAHLQRRERTNDKCGTKTERNKTKFFSRNYITLATSRDETKSTSQSDALVSLFCRAAGD